MDLASYLDYLNNGRIDAEQWSKIMDLYFSADPSNKTTAEQIAKGLGVDIAFRLELFYSKQLSKLTAHETVIFKQLLEGSLTLAQLAEQNKAMYYCSVKKNIGKLVSNMVKKAVLYRPKNGTYSIAYPHVIIYPKNSLFYGS